MEEERKRVVIVMRSESFAMECAEIAVRGVRIKDGRAWIAVLYTGCDKPWCWRFYFWNVGFLIENTQFAHTQRRILGDLATVPIGAPARVAPVPEAAPPTRYDLDQVSFFDIMQLSFPAWRTRLCRAFGIFKFNEMTRIWVRGQERFLAAVKPTVVVGAGGRVTYSLQKGCTQPLPFDGHIALMTESRTPRITTIADHRFVTYSCAHSGKMKHDHLLNAEFFGSYVAQMRFLRLFDQLQGPQSLESVLELARLCLDPSFSGDLDVRDEFLRLGEAARWSVAQHDRLITQPATLYGTSRRKYGPIEGRPVQIVTSMDDAPSTVVHQRHRRKRTRRCEFSPAVLNATELGSWTDLMESYGIDDPDDLGMYLDNLDYPPPIFQSLKAALGDRHPDVQFGVIVSALAMRRPTASAFRAVSGKIRTILASGDAGAADARVGSDRSRFQKRAVIHVMPHTDLPWPPRVPGVVTADGVSPSIDECQKAIDIFNELRDNLDNASTFLIYRFDLSKVDHIKFLAKLDEPDLTFVVPADNEFAQFLIDRGEDFARDFADTLGYTAAQRRKKNFQNNHPPKVYQVPGRDDISAKDDDDDATKQEKTHNLDAAVRDLEVIKLPRSGIEILVEKSEATDDLVKAYDLAVLVRRRIFGIPGVNFPEPVSDIDDDIITAPDNDVLTADSGGVPEPIHLPSFP